MEAMSFCFAKKMVLLVLDNTCQALVLGMFSATKPIKSIYFW